MIINTNPLATSNPGELRIARISDPEQVATVLAAVVEITRQWQLTDVQARELFDVPSATWSRMKADKFTGILSKDKITRASLLIGIFKSLQILFNGPLTTAWVTTPNSRPCFGGAAPLQAMIDGDIGAMYAVRQHLDALRGGV